MSDTPIHDRLLAEFQEWERVRNQPVIVQGPVESETVERFLASMAEMTKSMRRQRMIMAVRSAPEYFEPASADDIRWKHTRIPVDRTPDAEDWT